MERLPDIPPGEILQEEFLAPLGISGYRLAKDTGMPATRVSQILKGRRRITADTALRLSRYFGNSAEFWMGLQDEYDLREERHSGRAGADGLENMAMGVRPFDCAGTGWARSATMSEKTRTRGQLSVFLTPLPPVRWRAPRLHCLGGLDRREDPAGSTRRHVPS